MMDEMERKLEDLALTEVSVPGFECDLRTRLLGSFEYAKREARLRIFAGLSSGAALILLCVSIAFVVAPSVPARLKTCLVKAEIDADPENAVALIVDSQHEENARPPVLPPAVLSTMENDLDIIRSVMREMGEYGTLPELNRAKSWTVGAYQLSDGKEFAILTAFPPLVKTTEIIY